jgi:hypothetical protein
VEWQLLFLLLRFQVLTAASMKMTVSWNIAPRRGAAVFTPCSIGTNGLQLNHTRSMSQSDLGLQNYQASAVLPIIQRKYPDIALAFRMSFVNSHSVVQVTLRVYLLSAYEDELLIPFLRAYIFFLDVYMALHVSGL